MCKNVMIAFKNKLTTNFEFIDKKHYFFDEMHNARKKKSPKGAFMLSARIRD